MTPQEEIKTLTDYLEKLDAAADATRQRLEQLREAERPWPSVREARRALQNEWDPYELVALLGVGQDSDCEVYAYGVVRNKLQMQSASAKMGKYPEHPAGWRNSWTPAHEMRQD